MDDGSHRENHWLVIAAFVLVVLALILRVIGSVMSDGLSILYASIACSVLGGAFLITALVLRRRDHGSG